MRASLWKVAVLMGLVLAACFVPALEELDEEKAWSCNEEHTCAGGYSCMEGYCQPAEGTACRTGATAACGSATGECQRGTRSCGEDGTYGPCLGAVHPGAESCNGLDDDCDGLSDEGLMCGDGGVSCWAPHAPDSPCDDGNACTVNDTCTGSGSCVGSPMACNAPPSQCHQSTGTCSNGACSYALKSAGSSCDDGNACTSGDACDATGVCAGTSTACATPPSQCYQPTGTCANSSCSYAPKTAGSPCDDGNACTTHDRCDGAGACVVTVVSCNTPPTQCYQPTGTCSGGTCAYSLKPAGSSCNDGNACTTGDVCNSSGTCSGSTLACPPPHSYSCYQSLPGTCSDGACKYQPKPLGTTCGLNDYCDGNGNCIPGFQGAFR